MTTKSLFKKICAFSFSIVITFGKKDMRNHFLTILFCILFALPSFSQVLPDGYLKYKRGDYYLNGAKLDHTGIETILGTDIYQNSYKSAKTERTLGNVFIIAGGIAAGYGLAGGVYGEVMKDPNLVGAPRFSQTLINVFWGVAGTGAALLVAGIPLKIIGNNRLEKIADDYNIKHYNSPSLSMGITGNGIGLTFNF